MNKLGRTHTQNATYVVPRSLAFRFQRFLKSFTIYRHGGHLGHVTRTMFPHPKKLSYEIKFTWPSGSEKNVVGIKFDLDIKQIMVNLGSSFEQTWQGPRPQCYLLSPKVIDLSVPKIFEGFYHIQWPSWSCDQNYLHRLLFPHPKNCQMKLSSTGLVVSEKNTIGIKFDLDIK